MSRSLVPKGGSTNISGTSWYAGTTIAENERRQLAGRLADIATTWRQEAHALAATLPAITHAAAPHLDTSLKRRLDAALAAIISEELASLERSFEAGDTLVAMMAATPLIDAATKLVSFGFKPFLDLARSIASTLARLTPRIVPPSTHAAPTVPLIGLARDGKAALTHIARAIMTAQGSAPGLAGTIARNIAVATGQDPSDTTRALSAPHSLDGDAANVAVLVFADTPLLALFLTPVPIVVPLETRYRHTHIVAGAGWGKTQLLQHTIAGFLAEPNPPALVVIDSQGDMLNQIAHLDLFAPGKGRLADKLVIINPADTAHPPALNLFALNRARFAAMTPATREAMMNGLVELYETIFGAMLNTDLTQKQRNVFRYLTRLMFVIPGATILTLRQVLEDPAGFVHYAAQIEGNARDFLTNQLSATNYKETREQVVQRLDSILEQPTFERMFSTPDMKLDLYDCLQTGKIVLVNTAKDHMKAERSMILGRTFVAFTLQAAIERAAIPKERRHAAFLILDEASETLDSSAKSILETCRKYHVGLIAAHQQIDQLQPGVKAALAANTAIKMAGGVSDADAHTMAREMRTEPAAIRNLERGERFTQFLTYIDGVTPGAVPITTPFFTMEKMPRMTAAEHAQVITANRRRYCQSPATAPPRGLPAPRPGATPAPTVPPGKGRGAVPKRPPPAIPSPDDDWRS